MSAFATITDGLYNAMAKLGEAVAGVGLDKRSGNKYGAIAQDNHELMNMYRGSAIAKKIVDLPAEDACREWREWQAEADQITLIEAEERRLGLQNKVLKAKIRARLMGGCVIYIAIKGDDDLTQPLDPSRAANGGLEYLTVINRDDITPGQMQRDPSLPGYNMPQDYTVQMGAGGRLVLHPSRLVRFIGEELPDERYGAENYGWGDSSLLACIQNVSDLDATMGNIANLVFEAKIDVMGIEGFNDGLKNGGAAYEEIVKRRGLLIKQGKGINGQLMTDKNDVYSQKNASFAGLPDVTDRFMQMTAAAAAIPMTILFGMSPKGLNATGESDTRGYYDRVRVNQTQDMEPTMSILDECLIWSALGQRPDEVHFNWRPLWQPTAKEKAEVGKVTAETFQILSNNTDLPVEALDQALVNALTEGGAAPGLEGAVAEFTKGRKKPTGRDRGEPDEGDITSDAAPLTLYVRRDVLNADEVLAWAKEQGFKTTLPADDLHVTIMFSRRRVDWMAMGEAWQSEVEIAEGGARLMEQFGEAKVLLFSSSELSWRHEQMKREGATWDHAEYQPHITISYDPDAPPLADIEPYRGKIILGPEIFEEVNQNWLSEIAEE